MDSPDIIFEVAGTDNVVLECGHCGTENAVTRKEAEEAGYG
jgi:hypothetical protein